MFNFAVYSVQFERLLSSMLMTRIELKTKCIVLISSNARCAFAVFNSYAAVFFPVSVRSFRADIVLHGHVHA
jgi:hypothetical protein